MTAGIKMQYNIRWSDSMYRSADIKEKNFSRSTSIKSKSCSVYALILSYSFLLGSWCSSDRTKYVWSLFRATRKMGVSQRANEKTTVSLKSLFLNGCLLSAFMDLFLCNSAIWFGFVQVHCMSGNCQRLIPLESLGKIKIFD